MFRRNVVLFAVMAIIVTSAHRSFAQSVAVAQLSGTVTDESGGVLPGASVTVTQIGTAMTRRSSPVRTGNSASRICRLVRTGSRRRCRFQCV